MALFGVIRAIGCALSLERQSQTAIAYAEKQKFWRKMRIKFADWIKVCIFAL